MFSGRRGAARVVYTIKFAKKQIFHDLDEKSAMFRNPKRRSSKKTRSRGVLDLSESAFQRFRGACMTFQSRSDINLVSKNLIEELNRQRREWHFCARASTRTKEDQNTMPKLSGMPEPTFTIPVDRCAHPPMDHLLASLVTTVATPGDLYLLSENPFLLERLTTPTLDTHSTVNIRPNPLTSSLSTALIMRPSTCLGSVSSCPSCPPLRPLPWLPSFVRTSN